MSFIICHVILRPNADVFRSVSAVGTSPWTTSRSCFLYAKPSRTCSPRLTQGSRTWPFWVTSRPASGANAGRICWNWWITSASRLSPRNCRRNQMVCFRTIVKKTVSQSSAAAECINNVFCFFLLCLCSFVAPRAVGGAGCETESDAAADPSLWDGHGFCVCWGNACH